MKLFSRKPAYSQEEIAEQIGQIADLMKMRKSSEIVEEIDRFTTAIETAQLVLDHMLSEVTDGLVAKEVV